MIQSHPSTPQKPFRHLSYISRHPKIYLCWRCEVHCQEFLTARPQLGKAVIAYDLISNCYSINTVLATSRINQTPYRNPPDTHRQNAITSVLSLYNYIHVFLTDALHNANINRFDSVWKVSGGCLDESGYCLDGYHAKELLKLQ